MTTLEVKLVMLKELQARMTAVEAEIKAEWASVAVPGDRKTAAVTIGGQLLPLGSVTYTKGRSTYRITDPDAYMAWVEANHPDKITRTPVVADWFTKNLLDAEGVDTSTGEEVPGIDLVVGAPYPSVRPDKDAGHTIEDLLTSGDLSWSEVLELEP